MIKKLVSLVVLVFILMGVLGLTIAVREVEAPYPVIYIMADGSIVPSTANISSPDNVTYTFTADINASIVVEKNNTVVDGAGYTLQGSGSGIGISSVSSNVTIKNMEIKAFYEGINLGGSSNTVSGNNITANNWYGIVLFDGSDNTINGNNITNNGDGIMLDTVSNNTINGNNIKTNGPGIRILYSSNNKILNNNVTNNDGGIRLYGSSPNNTISRNILVNNTNSIDIVGVLFTTISRNHIAENNQYGIILDNASNNTISANNITNNNLGIFYDGLCNNNTAYHNNFVDNVKQVEVSPGDVDAWDDGVEGNYWSNYTGVDLDHDGIGDSWHEIDENNIDHYPLMGMFSEFNATSEYHVQTICNSSISDFQFNGTAISFNVTGETDTIGFCRICIPTALMNVTYKVYVNGTEVSYDLLPCSNSTHSYLYFTYNHSTQEVVIIPEFPTWTSMLLLLIVLTVAIAIYKRRLLKTPTH